MRDDLEEERKPGAALRLHAPTWWVDGRCRAHGAVRLMGFFLGARGGSADEQRTESNGEEARVSRAVESDLIFGKLKARVMGSYFHE